MQLEKEMSNLLAKMRRGILDSLYPFLNRAALRHKESMGRLIPSQTKAIEKLVEPGMVIISRKDYSPLNLLIPGYMSHCGVISTNGVIESIGAHGVRVIPLSEFLYSKDHIIISKPRFHSIDLPELMRASYREARREVGKKYDFKFHLSDQAFYCSELVHDSYERAYRNMTGWDLPFIPREVWGIKTILPDDFYRAKDYWQVVYDSEKSPLFK